MPLAYRRGTSTLAGTEVDFANLADLVYKHEGPSSLWAVVHDFRVDLAESPETPNWRSSGTRRLSRKRFRLRLPEFASSLHSLTLLVYVSLVNGMED